MYGGVSAALLMPIIRCSWLWSVSCRREGEEEEAAEGERLRHLHARRVRRSLRGQAGEIEMKKHTMQFFFIRLW